MNIGEIIIYTDGAARGNPGPAAVAAIIKDIHGNFIASVSRRIGVTTNNQAEYQAIIAGLQKAIELGAGRVKIKSDSELLVRQISGTYRVKNVSLKPLYGKVKQLQSLLEEFTITHIPRRENTEADKLANMALSNPVHRHVL